LRTADEYSTTKITMSNIEIETANVEEAPQVPFKTESTNVEEAPQVQVETTNVDEALQVQVANRPPAAKVSPQLPASVPDKTEINARLDEAVKAMPRVNRSADVVPLAHYYHLMRIKELKSIIAAANYYKASVLAKDKEILKESSLSEKTPIFEQVGSTTTEGVSLVSVTQDVSANTKRYTVEYRASVVDYCVEWERIVTSRVDEGLKETKKLRKRLNHFWNKVYELRQEERSAEDAEGGTPPKMKEKLDRLEQNLDQAWMEHERSASKLCNLIEQVARCGHKDLNPLVLDMSQWEIEFTSGDNEIFARLSETAEALTETMEKVTSVRPRDEENNVIVALADSGHPSDEHSGEAGDLEVVIEATGSYYSNQSSDQAITSPVEEEEEQAVNPVKEKEEEAFNPFDDEDEDGADDGPWKIVTTRNQGVHRDDEGPLEPSHEEELNYYAVLNDNEAQDEDENGLEEGEEEHMTTPPNSPKQEMDTSKAEEDPTSPERVTDFAEMVLW